MMEAAGKAHLSARKQVYRRLYQMRCRCCFRHIDHGAQPLKTPSLAATTMWRCMRCRLGLRPAIWAVADMNHSHSPTTQRRFQESYLQSNGPELGTCHLLRVHCRKIQPDHKERSP